MTCVTGVGAARICPRRSCWLGCGSTSRLGLTPGPRPVWTCSALGAAARRRCGSSARSATAAILHGRAKSVLPFLWLRAILCASLCFHFHLNAVPSSTISSLSGSAVPGAAAAAALVDRGVDPGRGGEPDGHASDRGVEGHGERDAISWNLRYHFGCTNLTVQFCLYVQKSSRARVFTEYCK